MSAGREFDPGTGQRDAKKKKDDGGGLSPAARPKMPNLGKLPDFARLLMERVFGRPYPYGRDDGGADAKAGADAKPPDKAGPEQALAQARKAWSQAKAKEQDLVEKVRGAKKAAGEISAQLKALKSKRGASAKVAELQGELAKLKTQQAKLSKELDAARAAKKAKAEKLAQLEEKQGLQKAAQDKKQATARLAATNKSLAGVEAELKQQRRILYSRKSTRQQKAAAKKRIRELYKRQKSLKAEQRKNRRAVRRMKENKAKVGSLWVNVNIAGPLSAAVNEIKAATGVDVTTKGASAFRSMNDDASKAGRAYFSWHKTGRAVDLSQVEKYLIVPDGRKYRLYLPTTKGGGIPGASLPRPWHNPYGRRAKKMNFVDVTEIFHKHGFNRVPRRGKVAEWWHYERGGGRSWYQAVMEIYGEKQVLKILKSHMNKGIVSRGRLRKHGVPVEKFKNVK